MAAAVAERRSMKRSYLGDDGEFAEFERQVVAVPPPKLRVFEAEDVFAQDEGVIFSVPIVTKLPLEGLDTTKPPYSKGGNGRVYRCTDTDGSDVAVKIFSRDRHDSQVVKFVHGRSVIEPVTTFLPVEIELMALKHLHRTTPHPNICVYRAGYAIAPDDTSAPEQFAALLDFCPGGSLFTRLNRGKPKQPLPNRLTLAKQLLSAVAYCHRSGFIHADIKPGNILLDASDNVKLADFGAALLRQRDPEGMYENLDPSDFVTTLYYRAPEMVLSYLSERIHRNTGSRYKIGCAADMWAIGCTLAEFVMPEVELFWTPKFDEPEIFAGQATGRPIGKGRTNTLLCRQMVKIVGYPKWPIAEQVLDMSRIYPPLKPLAQSVLRTRLEDTRSCKSEEIDLIAWMLSWRPEDRPSTATALAVYSRLT